MLNIVKMEYCCYNEQDIIFFKSEQIQMFIYWRYSIYIYVFSCTLSHRVATSPNIAQIIPKLSLPSNVGGVW